MQVELSLLEIVSGTIHNQKFRAGRNQLQRRTHFIRRSEFILGAVDEDGSGCERRKMLGARAVRLPGRVQGIGKKDQAIDQAWLLGREHGRLAPAVGMAGQPHRTRNGLPQCEDGIAENGPVGWGLGWCWGTGVQFSSEREVAAEHANSLGTEGIGDGDEDLGPVVAARTVGQNQADTGRMLGNVEEFVDGLVRHTREFTIVAVCRSIKVLRQPEVPATEKEISAAALQFVRKVSGFRAPSKANQAAFEAAVREIAESTERLLAGLQKPATPKASKGQTT